jgi:hypothetical protein
VFLKAIWNYKLRETELGVRGTKKFNPRDEKRSFTVMLHSYNKPQYF